MIRTYDKEPMRQPTTETRVMQTRVRFTEEEFQRLSHLVVHPLRSGAKTSVMEANLEQAAQSMWPTGSVDHVAMRHLGPITVKRYYLGHRMVAPEERPGRDLMGIVLGIGVLTYINYFHVWLNYTTIMIGLAAIIWFISRLGGPTMYRTTLERIGEETDASPPPADAELKNPTSQEVPPNMPKHGGATPEDAETNATSSEDGRTVVKDGMVGIIGQEHDQNVPHDRQPTVGVLLGPCQAAPNVYTKSKSNLESAIKNRLTDKARPCNLSKADFEKIGWVIFRAIGNDEKRSLFSTRRIQAWCETNLHLESLASGKWSQKRIESAIMNLVQTTEVEYRHKADIKLEAMPEGKAPRMLIADGDDGQLMALCVVKCFEDLLFEWFEDKSIKHLGKRDAVDRVVQQLSKNGSRAIEGDGSAWDTTCNAKIRGAVENPVLRHIFDVMVGYGVVPEQWHEEHLKANETNKLKVLFNGKWEKARLKIDAIRRSGHRGTSCLNWWMNYVMWVCSIFKEPQKFLDPCVRNGKDNTGKTRWWNGAFEGDDSLCTMSPPMIEGDDLSKAFLDWWEKAGFNMKIVFCDSRATFVGWHIQCVNGALTNIKSPELPRALKNSGVGVSAGTIQAYKEGKTNIVKTVAAASSLARAGEFAGILPTVSRKYMAYSKSFGLGTIKDREMSMRVYGTDDRTSNELEEMIESRNLAVTPQMEHDTLLALGYECSAQELDRFMLYPWEFTPDCLQDYSAFRESLPARWRT